MPRMGDLAATDVYNAFDVPLEQAYDRRLDQTWPGQLAQDAIGAVLAPGRALQSTEPITTEQMIKPAADLAGLVTLGAGAVPAGANELRAGFVGRKLPTDNYTGPVSRYTDELFREMSPREALESLPTSVASAAPGMGGNRKFYADQPELALGQGSNRGVRVTYDAAPFEGQINKKPGWEALFPEGSAEYVAAPTTNIRETVKGFEIDQSALSKVEKAQYQRLLSNLEAQGWDVSRSKDKITVTRPSMGALAAQDKYK